MSVDERWSCAEQTVLDIDSGSTRRHSDLYQHGLDVLLFIDSTYVRHVLKQRHALHPYIITGSFPIGYRGLGYLDTRHLPKFRPLLSVVIAQLFAEACIKL
jgi:hypothetical protein